MKSLLVVALTILGLTVIAAVGTDQTRAEFNPREPDGCFTNSRAMPFVHFGDSNMMICVWETRNCDYGAFIQQTGRKWSEVQGVQREPLHPAVKVSWEDANEFCRWLTACERKSGLISSNWAYRLPTDEEWGKALGLERERGETPVERFFYGGPSLPWGEAWPPPSRYANLGPKVGIDDWKYTAPVGSFPANRYGIFDLVGNVAEWCSDVYDPAASTGRTIRGSSYGSNSRNECAASVRVPSPASNAMPNVGFRCVLALVSDAGEAKPTAAPER